ncbi:hypothetical protein ACOJBM_34970 [Rhizobium beringeri]
MARNARLRADRRPEQRASCRHRLATQLLSRGDLAIAMRVPPITETLSSNHGGHRDRARGQGTVSVSVPVSVSVSVSVSTTLSHEARRANEFGSQGQTWYLPVDNVNGYCRPLSPALLF